MGCDIHSFAERKKNGKWEKVGEVFSLDDWSKEYYKKDKTDSPFYWRSYSMFGFLANVRNYDKCKPLAEPKGFPYDASDEVVSEFDQWEFDAHSASYLTVKELLDFDYDKTFYNEIDQKYISYRENLRANFFEQLEELKALGNPEDVRIVFWFDN